MKCVFRMQLKLFTMRMGVVLPIWRKVAKSRGFQTYFSGKSYDFRLATPFGHFLYPFGEFYINLERFSNIEVYLIS